MSDESISARLRIAGKALAEAFTKSAISVETAGDKIRKFSTAVHKLNNHQFTRFPSLQNMQ